MTALEDFEDLDIEEIRGAKKRPDMGLLNTKKRLSKFEMDELFCEE